MSCETTKRLGLIKELSAILENLDIPLEKKDTPLSSFLLRMLIEYSSNEVLEKIIIESENLLLTQKIN